ncbi:MAG: nitrate- and nitrite sensing domain-containing protein [Betaproteobacteria bacterium]|nr:nitrate- and nitrite sensing domain-containing protein [Betaproteobacteria bacterium]
MALNKVVQLTQTHRGLSAGTLSGNQAFAARRPGMRDQVVQAMTTFEASLREAGASPKLLSLWSDANQNWRKLEQAVGAAQIKAPESTKLHTQLIVSMLVLNEEILAEFALSLDPDADSYFLIQASLVNLPWLTENLGIMCTGIDFLTLAALPLDGRATLAALNKRAIEVQGEMTRNFKRAMEANPKCRPCYPVGHLA